MRPVFIALLLVLGSPAVHARVDMDLPVNVTRNPRLVPVPGLPVHYAPQVDANYFYYGGSYWVYDANDWYASSDFNGPWRLVDRTEVPGALLRVPVRYYNTPPHHFRDWRADAAPRWNEFRGRRRDARTHGGG